MSDERGATKVDCGAQAALYTAPKGFKLWITRRGTMIEDNPLRPLSHDSKLVLQVAVNGKVATAYGANFENLLRGGPPDDLERANSGPIHWEPTIEAPSTIRVVSEDGSVVLGPLQFVECGEAPKIAPVQAAKRAKGAGAPKSGRAPEKDGRPGLILPQGAIP